MLLAELPVLKLSMFVSKEMLGKDSIRIASDPRDKNLIAHFSSRRYFFISLHLTVNDSDYHLL